MYIVCYSCGKIMYRKDFLILKKCVKCGKISGCHLIKNMQGYTINNIKNKHII